MNKIVVSIVLTLILVLGINKISDVRSPLNRVINDADKNMRIPGWKPEYNVQQGTFLYRNNLKFELNDGLK